ncbi:hypothetical protein MFRU_017g00400 [Monilinia fructicola]|nr:hypothetical protein MFRU_017g00400 [Monilinia fructicola]
MKDNDEEPAESSKAPNKRKRQATKPSMKGKAVAQSSDDEMPDVHGETISDSNADYDSVEWTEEDQILLDFTHDYEISLWRRTKSIFNCAPFDLFPKGIKAASDDWSGYDYNGQFIKNETSLTIPLCKSLCTLVCFPFFDGDIEFVRYALSTALRSRCGDRPPLEMEGYDVWVAFEAEFDTLSKNLKTFGLFLDDSQLGKLKDALEYHPSLLRLSKEYKFVNEELFKKVLESARTIKEKGDSFRLMNHDVTTIIKAWEIWNKESKRYLPTMDEFEDSWQKSSVKDMKVPRDMVLQWKKDWILKKRIEAKNERDEKKNQSPKEDEDVFEDQDESHVQSPLPEDDLDEDESHIQSPLPEDDFHRDESHIQAPLPENDFDQRKDTGLPSVPSILGDEDANQIVQDTEEHSVEESQPKSNSDEVQTVEKDSMVSSTEEDEIIEDIITHDVSDAEMESLTGIRPNSDMPCELDISNELDIRGSSGYMGQVIYHPTQLPPAWEVNYKISRDFDLDHQSQDISIALSLQSKSVYEVNDSWEIWDN